MEEIKALNNIASAINNLASAVSGVGFVFFLMFAFKNMGINDTYAENIGNAIHNLAQAVRNIK